MSNLWTVAATGDTIKIMRGREMNWRKSKHSGANGQCVEIANANDWRKSQRSMTNGNCVEVRSGVAIRDTADRDGVTLTFEASAWERFVDPLR